MYKALLIPALLFVIETKAQSVTSLENKDHKLSLSVLKAINLNVDLITITATYYGNETNNAVHFVPLWKLSQDGDKCTVIFDVESFDMTKPFKVILHRGTSIVKTFELSDSASFNGETLSRYHSI